MTHVKYIVLNTKTLEAAQFDTPARVSVYMLGKITKDYVITKIVETTRTLQDTPNDICDLEKKLEAL